MIDWQEVVAVAGILSAIGVIIGFAVKYGGAITKLVAWAWSKMDHSEVYNNGAMKEHNDAVEELTAVLKKISTELQENTRVTLKLELKDLFKNHPERINIIEETMEEYHAVNGDSYIDALYDEWAETYRKANINNDLKQQGAN